MACVIDEVATSPDKYPFSDSISGKVFKLSLLGSTDKYLFLVLLPVAHAVPAAAESVTTFPNGCVKEAPCIGN